MLLDQRLAWGFQIQISVEKTTARCNIHKKFNMYKMGLWEIHLKLNLKYIKPVLLYDVKVSSLIIKLQSTNWFTFYRDERSDT